MRAYTIKSIFRTIQGEGFNAGTPATFIRFAGCNLWNGRDEDRPKYTVPGEARCPSWCDTDFVGGDRVRLTELLVQLAMPPSPRLIVLTGGEPLLQVDEDLILGLLAHTHATIAIETNGTKELHLSPRIRADRRLWVSLSPKLPREALNLSRANEVRVVFPAYDPAEYIDFPADHFFVSPQASPNARSFANEEAAAAYVQTHPHWRLSLQQHKVLDIP